MPDEDLAAEIDQAVEEKLSEVKEEVVASSVDNEKEVVKEEITDEEEISSEVVDDEKEVIKEEVTDETVDDEIVDDEPLKIDPPLKISDDVLTRAVQAGIPLADARKFPNEESLAGITARMDSARQEYEEDLKVLREAEAEKSKPAEKKDPFAGLPELDQDTYEPEVIKYFEGLRDIVKQQQETIEGFQGQHEDQSEASRIANSREVEKWFNGQVAELGEDFTEDLGAGDYASLSRGSLQYVNRERLADQVSVLLSGYEAMGQEAPPREEVFRSAARLVFTDKYQKIHEKKLAKDLEGQASQHIQRASGQKITHKESPMEEAAREIDEKYFSG